MLAANPNSMRARCGLGRIAIARGELEQAQGWFEGALESDPESVDARVGLADVAVRRGDVRGASRWLGESLQRDRARADVHARLAALTGEAPEDEVASLEEAVARADAHPYDPGAVLAAGERLAADGQRRSAVTYLERVLWLADLDPAAAERAATLLPTLSDAWRERRVVTVHAYADEIVRGWPGWRFRLRTLWLSVSKSLDAVLGTRFVVGSIQPFQNEGLGRELDRIHAGLWSSVRGAPTRGILAGFTGQPLPQRYGFRKAGLAEYTGRLMTLRVARKRADERRVLAHEILHLYGGVHVAPDLESLMNPEGDSLKLDRFNFRVARALRGRRFVNGGVQQNVIPVVDLEETTGALVDVLNANLTFRRLGLAQAVRSAEYSRYLASNEWKRAKELDPHLADVSVFLAYLKLADGREAEAVNLLEVAAELYGRDTPRGRATRSWADAFRSDLRRRYGAPPAP